MTVNFNAAGQVPGVYIKESDVPGPIPGVGTSTAAIVGPALSGPINTPTPVTNFDQFKAIFGGYITSPMVFATHAVKGFFDEGGSNCYFVRTGTAVRASRVLFDRSGGAGRETLVVQAKKEGLSGNSVTVDVQDQSIVATRDVVQASANLSGATGNTATLANAIDAANFRPGDIVLIGQPAAGANPAKSERARIANIGGTTITLQTNLSTPPYDNTATIRIADLNNTQDQIRVVDTAGIEPGSYIKLTRAAVTENAVVKAVDRFNNFIILSKNLTNTYAMGAAPQPTVQTLEFRLLFSSPSFGAEDFPNLSMDPRHPRYFAKIVDSKNVSVTLFSPNPTSPPDNRPGVTGGPQVLQNGADDDLSALTDAHYNAAIDTLKRVDDVNLLCVPDNTNQAVQVHMIDHCDTMHDRFAILDPVAASPGPDPTTDVLVQRLGGVPPSNPGVASLKGFAALYFPRIAISGPAGTGRILVPPSGHIAGVMARTDNDRGVHKAPANERIKSALDLEATMTDPEMGKLNDAGVNVIRAVPGLGIAIWGARTIAPSSSSWRFVNVRRLLLFIEESIQEGTQFAVFEPNDLGLRKKVERQSRNFLTRVWQSGALFGATPDEAFRVRVDDQLNPPDVRALGQLIIEIVVVPTTPAEYIVFQVIQDPTGAAIKE